jgi:hypothetical protein
MAKRFEMHALRLSSLIIFSLFSWIQVASAVTLPGESAANPYDVNSVGIVERGGVVDAVDFSKRILVVDGVNYHFQAMPVVVHLRSGIGDEKSLKPRMTIRFTTSRNNHSAQDQIQEIWVTGYRPKPVLK